MKRGSNWTTRQVFRLWLATLICLHMSHTTFSISQFGMLLERASNIFQTIYKNNECFSETVQKLNSIFGRGSVEGNPHVDLQIVRLTGFRGIRELFYFRKWNQQCGYPQWWEISGFVSAPTGANNVQWTVVPTGDCHRSHSSYGITVLFWHANKNAGRRLLGQTSCNNCVDLFEPEM